MTQRKIPAQIEYQIYRTLALRLRTRYPDALYRFDLGGIRLPIGLAKKVKGIQSKRGFPDLIIYERRLHYIGFATEIKTSRKDAFTGKGELRQDEHIREQSAMLEEFSKRGWFTAWGLGLDETWALIEMYLNSDPAGNLGPVIELIKASNA
jgi:hypothetical protein